MKALAELFSSSGVGALLPVRLCFLFGVFVFGPLIAADYAPEDLGDARFDTFVLEHVYQFLMRHAAYFASP